MSCYQKSQPEACTVKKKGIYFKGKGKTQQNVAYE